MATMFWDAKGVILFHILPKGQYINSAQYCSTLDRQRDVIRRKRPGLLRGVLCLSTIMRYLIQQTLHSNGCRAMVGKFFLILPTIQTLHPLTFTCLDP
ncbi:histone-lysine N-methyltransferase SETMAR [Elysia marginata]|uniref:Histone-lysine N-methyltransferase SETMAR n=1 Tax=Elysia marginata TaxID=1093978 RepID=A0AAV4IFQ3_9GAST|nr:histone-lysine N-methyltransferase SETMAR [Elysia marginata]